MRKRVLGVLLCLMLTVGMLPIAAHAGSAFPDVSDDADYAWAAKLTNEMGIFAGDNNGNFNPDQGIINGYGNGKFGPSDTVTYEQAIKMLMAGIGYGDAAVDAGGYPNGYISVADNYGLLDGVENTFGTVITRANIAVLVANIASS